MDIEDFELTATNTTTLYPSQFNFYDKLSINYYQSFILIGFCTVLALLSLLLFVDPSKHIYIYRAVIVTVLGFAALSLPTLIKLVKLSSRGTPYTAIGIDFSRSEILFKNSIKELFSYSPEKIQSLEITELSKDASLWSVNNKNHFKVPHEIHMPHLLGKTEYIIGLRDNRFIIKLIAHLLLVEKDVKVSGPHWKIKNLLDHSKNKQEKNTEDASIYYSNEATGAGFYKLLTAASIALFAASLYFKDGFLAITSIIFSAYFVYILINNPSFLQRTATEIKDATILPALLDSVKKLNPNTAHMLTVPYKIVYPHTTNKDKKVERIMILTKEDSLMIFTASGKNLLE